MSVTAWLAGRRPEPPSALRSRLGGREGADLVETLERRAHDALERSLAASGRREGAWDLLAADALLTYACEAALDCDDPDGALMGLLDRAASPSR